jgi:hypothetical protein
LAQAWNLAGAAKRAAVVLAVPDWACEAAAVPRAVVLWSMPRSGSTAFERMMIERGDHTVRSEPFSQAYYDGPARRSERFETTQPGATIERIAGEIIKLAAREPVFVKDMAYHVCPGASEADTRLLAHFNSTFLIRDPAWSVPSLARQWPDFTLEEVGIDALEDLVAAVEHLGTDPVIVDHDDVRADPQGMVRAWCDAVGIPFLPDALSWKRGSQPGWDRWSEWHETTSGTTGFLPRSVTPPPTADDPRVADAIAATRVGYERLHMRRVQPSS